jgi:hypothetical protein
VCSRRIGLRRIRKMERIEKGVGSSSSEVEPLLVVVALFG